MSASVEVNDYSERWLRKGFPWVYPKEIRKGRPRPGEEVLIRGKGGKLLGRGIADKGFIAVRVFRHDDGPLDDAWLHATLDAASAHRERVIEPGTTGFRLVHGENDGLPGIRIDWWDHFAVITLDTPALAVWIDRLAGWLQARKPRGIYVCYRPDPRDPREVPPPSLVAGKKATADVTVRERGMNLLVRPWDGPDVGVYADMRPMRAWLEPHWGGRAVLNTFAYTGAFSVAAALGGATEVVSVDLSSKVLDRVEANYRANDLDPANFEQIASDTFKALDRLRRTGQRFDLVILDPPSFSRAKEGVWSAKKDYPRLVAAAARVMNPEGWLIAASNQGELSPRDFRGYVARGLDKAGRSAQEIFWTGPGPDFPAGVSFPEAHYLKVGVWRLL